MVTGIYQKLIIYSVELTTEQKRQLLKRAVELLGYPKLTQITNRSKKQLYLYVRGYDKRGKEIEPHDEVVTEVMKALPVDEVVKIVHGINYTDVPLQIF
ncbi:hypothetical protein Saci_0678 [Sulfolobus acidocaldarius DSM 639]|uniref:Uncharacterized protein n=1 Tax=Sulfolobus acidocaldarius (strain ATCC 33909 / DSM 639 / JCM 8929 / NBRC 15157 / NCIMB 11770) TaxID=330779 RepID=Q4JAW9_SULAC|nr:hypothetical protein [Sulfolobus acidocaldarius]AAY80060.1 hypothetical protein Saci_0678 [Sulfolobus acidocaldarius DSM 639]